GDHAGDFLGLAHAVDHRAAELDAAPFGIFEDEARLVGLDRAGRYRIGADAVLAAFHGELARHREYAAFGRRMGETGEQFDPRPGRERGGVDDAALGFLQLAPRGAGEQEDEIELLVDRLGPGFIVHV